ncbi:MAG: GDP-mannose 4,6-dehydratase [Candidatus Dormibacteria bacterium]
MGRDWDEFVTFAERFARPSDVGSTVGDPRRARDVLGWEPRTEFAELIRVMVTADLVNEGLRPGDYLNDQGAPLNRTRRL